jgi:CRISPR-associated protein Cas8a1/Csx13
MQIELSLNQSEKEQPEATFLHFNLADPYMTFLHRAGLAGLYMTLKQLEKENVQTIGGLSWQLSDRAVSLSWEGNDFEVLDWLLKESFQIRDGLISLRGLDAKTMDIQPLVMMHQGILGTLLQHNSTHKSIGIQERSFLIEDNKPETLVKYKGLSWYVYQDFAANLCDKKTGKLLEDAVAIAGWLNPGAAVRHIAFSANTCFEETVPSALILLFAPIACYYFSLRSKLRSQRAQFALIIPEVTNLHIYAQYRQNPQLRNLGFRDFYTSSLGDAGLRFLSIETTATTLEENRVKTCQVITLGTVAWSTQQKTRTDLYTVTADQPKCKNYCVCRNFLSDRVVVKEKDNTSWVATNFAREMIADNLARGKPWFAGLSENVNSSELFKQLTYERDGLNKMVKSQSLQWSDRERLFVQSCHEAISRTYRQLADRTKEGEEIRFKKVNEKFRAGLGRCKSPNTFREFITDFWARAGSVPVLKEHWDEIMELVMTDWKSARDLSLLALASYKSKGSTSAVQADNGDQDSGLGMVDHFDEDEED